MSNKIRGPERNFGQIRLVSGSLDRPCHDLYYTQLKCYRAVRASRDIYIFFFAISKDINIVFYGALLVLLSLASVPRASVSVLAPEVNSDRSPRSVQFPVHSFD